MTPIQNGIDARASAYAGHLRDQWVRFAVLSASIAITLVPLFSILDYFVYPSRFLEFLAIRIGCAGFIALAVAVVVRWMTRLVKPVTIASFFLVQLMICYMIVVTEGAHSGYYAGLNLPIITMGFFLPTVLYETAAFCSASVALYVVASLLAPGSELGVKFFEHLFFLVSVALIACYSTWFLGKSRESEFDLSFELERRNRELANINAQRSNFFSNVSHELRTPLTLILAPVQELLQSGQHLSDHLASRLGIVRDNAFRLLKLVNELLDLIRLEEGKDALENVPVEVNGLLDGLASAMVHLADAKEVELDSQLAPGRLVVRGDPRAFEKVFVNLLGNAVKFTDRGGRVRVSTWLDDGSVVVAVADTGIGIAPDDHSRVFERFRQADGSSTRRFRGTGLGLALVKELSERMGGQVALSSALGVGTTMTLRFPAVADLIGERCEAPDLAAEDDALESMHREAQRRGGVSIDEPDSLMAMAAEPDGSGRATVLIVEDEPDMRRYLAEVLQTDYRVLTARNGLDGLAIALEREPDLVVLDLMLPQLDGLEVCRRIRSDSKAHAARIMLLTARADEHSKLTALENGADDFLTKPFSTVEVKTRLRNLLENARLERDLAARNARLECTLAELKTTQAQLIQSEKLNALGSLSAGLLHEINNPLNYSLTALQLLAGDPTVQGDELMREIVTDINEGMQRIRAIVSDLRAFAYPSEAEKQGAFDLNEAVEAALRFAAQDLRDIDVVRNLGGRTLVVGSKSHLTQVFINLFSNGAKAILAHRDGRPGRIRVEAESRNGRLWVRVADNGIGMDQATLGRIFDPFFTTREVGEGMGLGLSVCHTIVVNHQGRLSAASQLGVGTEMGFDLALADRVVP